MSKISNPLVQMESCARCLGGRVFFPVPEEIVYSFLVYFGIIQIWPMYYSLDKRIWFTIILLPLKECPTLFRIWILFLLSLHLFFPAWSYREYSYQS